ncbi:phosphatase PAP2 family protein [bacterium]|nr:MAG: phosphatase PAP2 family protein [bacterium]
MTFAIGPRAVRYFSTAALLICSFTTIAAADPLDETGFHRARDGFSTISPASAIADSKTTSTKQQWIRTADSLLTTTLITYGLKSVIHEDRPDDSGDDSFPSLHTSAAFSIAATQAYFHPKQAPYWYGAATLVGIQRVHADKHYWHDVAAGAALGYFTARLEVRQKNGLLLRPFIRDNGSNNPAGQTRGLNLTKFF